MTVEFSQNKAGLLKKAEHLLSLKRSRLPKGIRDYIRTLKESGQLERAAAIGRLAHEEKTQRRVLNAVDELQATVVDIIQYNNGDVVDHLVNQVKAIWILDRMNIINGAERYEELKAVIERQSPDTQKALEARFPSVKMEINRLFPTRRI
ncbi:hypothetical protein MUP46_04590 [Patescibacteria group bacterium]|nr:hypothetical protein [Patescibacteria group bacterium]